MSEWKCRGCGSADATNAWHDWCGTCAEDPATIIEALHDECERLKRNDLDAIDVIHDLGARAESAEARVAELEKENERLRRREESFRVAFEDGSLGLDWLQKNLPTKYLGKNVINAAADYITELEGEIRQLRTGSIAGVAKGHIDGLKAEMVQMQKENEKLRVEVAQIEKERDYFASECEDYRVNYVPKTRVAELEQNLARAIGNTAKLGELERPEGATLEEIVDALNRANPYYTFYIADNRIVGGRTVEGSEPEQLPEPPKEEAQ